MVDHLFGTSGKWNHRQCQNSDCNLIRKLNWQVQGIELDAEAVKAAYDIHNLTVKQGTLLDVKFPD